MWHSGIGLLKVKTTSVGLYLARSTCSSTVSSARAAPGPGCLCIMVKQPAPFSDIPC